MNDENKIKSASDNERAEMLDNQPSPAVVNPNAPKGFSKVTLGLLPFSPAPLTGNDAWIGYTRLALYTLGGSYALSKKRKTLGYAMLGAAGLSLATSLSSKAWNG